MSLLLTNAVINTFAGGVAKLTNAPALLDAPSPLDMAQFGGIVRYALYLDPGSPALPTDIQVGDDVQLVSWGQFGVDSAKRYRVFSAPMDGGLGLEVFRLIIGDKVQR